MNMMISGISTKNGKKLAYILFDEGTRSAEAVIPECKVTKNKGFTGEEITLLEKYMRENLEMLKAEAAKIDPVNAVIRS